MRLIKKNSKQGILFSFLSSMFLFMLLIPSGAHSDPITLYDVAYHTDEQVFLDMERQVINGHLYYDFDYDHLNDQQEFEIAHYFKPYLSFDYWENACRYDLGEPLVLFQICPVDQAELLADDNPLESCTSDDLYLNEGCRGIYIKYRAYFELDGGPESHSHEEGSLHDCGNCHLRDVESISLWLMSEDGGSTWRVVKAYLGVDHAYHASDRDYFKRRYNQLDIWDVAHGSHPVTYYAGGKHHQYFYPDSYCRPDDEDVYYHCSYCTEIITESEEWFPRKEFLPIIYNIGEPWMFPVARDEVNNLAWEEKVL